MFKNILIATDGSKLSSKGVQAGVKLAKSLGARVTGVHVTPPYDRPAYIEGAGLRGAISPAAYRKATEREARKALAEVEIEAGAAKVAFSTEAVTAGSPWEGILEVAKKARCDAIAIASHGRSNLGGLLLGSETAHVLSRSKIPVLVVR
jgi:nucleotide-binding universal stress UspA family protein